MIKVKYGAKTKTRNIMKSKPKLSKYQLNPDYIKEQTVSSPGVITSPTDRTTGVKAPVTRGLRAAESDQQGSEEGHE